MRSGIAAAGTSLTFNNTFDSTVTTAYQNCIIAAESFLSNVFKPINSVTVAVSFDQQAAERQLRWPLIDN